MRIGIISTYPPIECGIAAYTGYLTEALRNKGNQVYIISHLGASGKNVFPAFDYEDGDLAEKAFSATIRLTPDLVHIQHEFGLYGKHTGVSVIPLIMEFRLAGIRVCTTLHTVYPESPEQHRIILTAIVENADAIIVHEPYQLSTLRKIIKTKGQFKKIHLIPHGARELQPTEGAKAKLGIPETAKVALMIGYFRPSKGFERIIKLWPKVAEKYKENDVRLIIAGKVRNIQYIDYRNMLFREINSSPARSTIKVIRGQISQDSFDTIISAADVVILPYQISSQSGIVAHCLALGKSIVTSNTQYMVSLIEKAQVGLISDTDQDYIKNIGRILTDDKLRKTFSENAFKYVREEVSWSRVADEHIRIYKNLVEPSLLKADTIWMD